MTIPRRAALASGVRLAALLLGVWAVSVSCRTPAVPSRDRNTGYPPLVRTLPANAQVVLTLLPPNLDALAEAVRQVRPAVDSIEPRDLRGLDYETGAGIDLFAEASRTMADSLLLTIESYRMQARLATALQLCLGTAELIEDIRHLRESLGGLDDQLSRDGVKRVNRWLELTRPRHLEGPLDRERRAITYDLRTLLQNLDQALEDAP
jgi:hypothetical protein